MMLFELIDFAILILTAILFLFRNPQRDFKYLIALFIAGLLLTPPAFLYFSSPLPGKILWGISTIGLLGFYSLRFKAKKEKTKIDYFKILALLLLILYPMTSAASPESNEGHLLTIINKMTFYFIGTIFLYDRLITKANGMNRRIIIILAAQTLLVGVFWLYGFEQKTKAESNADEAYRQRQISEQIKFENDKLKDALKNCR